jgi:hypothetical protein
MLYARPLEYVIQKLLVPTKRGTVISIKGQIMHCIVTYAAGVYYYLYEIIYEI